MNEVAENRPTFSSVLAERLNTVKAALPAEFNQQRFIQNAIALINDNKEIQKFPKEQILSGLMKGAYLGLDFFNKEAYLIPYKGDLQYQTSYTGMQKLVRRYSSRPVKDIYAKLVREGDFFEETIVDGMESVTFRPKPFNKGAVIGAFAVCVFEDSGMRVETMSLEELENARKSSKASNSPAWEKWRGEMQKKCVIKRLCKHIGLDFDSTEQLRVYNSDMEIETDVRVVAEQEIAEGENKEEIL